MTCHNCGLPPGALSQDGYHVQVTVKAENNFKRDRTPLVWCCSEECVVQAAFQSRYGGATNKAPITLDQFRTLWRKENAR